MYYIIYIKLTSLLNEYIILNIDSTLNIKVFTTYCRHELRMDIKLYLIQFVSNSVRLNSFEMVIKAKQNISSLRLSLGYQICKALVRSKKLTALKISQNIFELIFARPCAHTCTCAHARTKNILNAVHMY